MAGINCWWGGRGGRNLLKLNSGGGFITVSLLSNWFLYLKVNLWYVNYTSIKIYEKNIQTKGKNI